MNLRFLCSLFFPLEVRKLFPSILTLTLSLSGIINKRLETVEALLPNSPVADIDERVYLIMKLKISQNHTSLQNESDQSL